MGDEAYPSFRFAYLILIGVNSMPEDDELAYTFRLPLHLCRTGLQLKLYLKLGIEIITEENINFMI